MIYLSPAQWNLARLVYRALASIAVFGVFSNLLLAFVTFRTPSLRSTCHILIGLCALFDGVHQVLPEMAVLGGCACTLSIGLERAPALLAITYYNRIGRKRYLTAHLFWIAACALYAVCLMAAHFETERQFCAVLSIFHGPAADRWIQFIGLLNLATFVTYCVMAIVVSRKTGG